MEENVNDISKKLTDKKENSNVFRKALHAMQEVDKLKTSTPITEKKKIEKEKATNVVIDSAKPKNDLKKTGAIQKKFDEGKKQDDGENILVDDDEESDEQFSERMKVYYEKRRDNYIKN